jgi:hypothetical protein
LTPENTIAEGKTLPSVRAGTSFQYVHGAAFDWIFFLAPFWASLLYFALVSAFPAHEVLIFILSYIVLAETHFASTWTFYLDPDNRKEYAAHKRIYYYVPLIIMVACVLLSFSVSLKLTMLIGALASAVHVTRQSCGIVGLYRSKARQFEPAQKLWENWSLYFASGAFLAFGFQRFYLGPNGRLPGPLNALLQPFLPVFTVIPVLLGVAALFAVFKVLGLEVARAGRGEPLSASKLLVFGYSLFLYSPYLFATRMEHAVAMGVGVHYVQYLGIVWLLNKNKYRAAEKPSFDRRVLTWLSQHVWVRLPYLLFYAGVMTYLRQDGFRWDNFEPTSWLYSIPIGLQVVHYYLDAYLWRFSNPFVRSSVLPYIRRVERA